MLYINILFAYRKFFYDGNIQRQDNLQFKQKYINKCVFSILLEQDSLNPMRILTYPLFVFVFSLEVMVTILKNGRISIFH